MLTVDFFNSGNSPSLSDLFSFLSYVSVLWWSPDLHENAVPVHRHGCILHINIIDIPPGFASEGLSQTVHIRPYDHINTYINFAYHWSGPLGCWPCTTVKSNARQLIQPISTAYTLFLFLVVARLIQGTNIDIDRHLSRPNESVSYTHYIYI